MNDGGLGGDGTSHPILGFIRPAPTVRLYPPAQLGGQLDLASIGVKAMLPDR
jgi:hypothetical protein